MTSPMRDETPKSVVVKSGLSVLRDELLPELWGKRVAVLCHAASVDENLVHIVDILVSGGVEVVRIFAPEHGLWGYAQDQVPVAHTKHPKHKIPIISLYGKELSSLSPKAEELADVDLAIVDLQDVGARYYTFVWTALLFAEAAARARVKVLILDRPNPIGGAVEGPVQEEGFLSFVGLHPVPIRHGMTIGDLLRFVCAQRKSCEVEVVRMVGWRQSLWFDQTGLLWVLPSPNMPTLETATLYPGVCLLEGTNVSEGRGTTKPFEIIGAPFLNPYELAERLSSFDLPGVGFRPLVFIPTRGKHAGMRCGGVQIHVTQREALSPVLLGFALVKALLELAPEEFSFKQPPYEFVRDKLPFDVLTGSPSWREMLVKGAPLDEIKGAFEPQAKEFEEKRRDFISYPQ